MTRYYFFLFLCDVAESFTNDKARNWLGSLYNNIDWTHFEAEDDTAALDLFGPALTFPQQQGSTENTRIAQWCISKTVRHLSQLEEPLAIMQALFSENGSNAQFLMPDGRTDAYTIIEVTIIEGRTTDTKKI